MTDRLRQGVRSALERADAAVHRVYGWRLNPLHHAGAIAVALLGVLVATGVYLLFFYRIGAPYESVERITAQAWTGRWIRTLHRYAADAALFFAALHGLRMFARGRSWGPRALAWVSGLVGVFFFFVCGWTGYVLVWDNHAQVVAVAGARLLDVLPLFSEPLGRAFVGERPMPGAFFFINFFFHVALPLGVGLVLWVHVARVARPRLLPARPLAWGVVGLLFAASLLWPLSMAPAADPLRLPARVPLDLFYGFWIPLAERTPPGAVWLAFVAVAVALLWMPAWTRPPAAERPAPSVVDERACTGCEQCYHDCPYEAIEMVPRTDGRPGMVARVDPALCVSCGICAGSCAPMVVGPPGRTGREQLARTRAGLEARPPGPHEVVVVACTRGAGGLAAGGAALPAGVRLHPVQCAGNLHTSVVEHYLRAGAGGVMVVACPPTDCWNREGAAWAAARLFDGREAELKERVDRRRVRLAHAGRAERGAVLRELETFRAELARLALAEGEDDVDVMALCEKAAGPEVEAEDAETGDGAALDAEEVGR